MEVDTNGEPMPVFGENEKQPEIPEQTHTAFNIEEYTQRAIYFNNRKQKTIPVITRNDKGRAAKKPRKKQEELTMECIKEKIFDVETKYEEAIKPFNLSWASLTRK